jgi:hypothetical protein
MLTSIQRDRAGGTLSRNHTRASTARGTAVRAGLQQSRGGIGNRANKRDDEGDEHQGVTNIFIFGTSLLMVIDSRVDLRRVELQANVPGVTSERQMKCRLRTVGKRSGAFLRRFPQQYR